MTQIYFVQEISDNNFVTFSREADKMNTREVQEMEPYEWRTPSLYILIMQPHDRFYGFPTASRLCST